MNGKICGAFAATGRGGALGYVAALVAIGLLPQGTLAGEFDEFLKPMFAERCVKCHGGEKVKGKVNLKEIASAEQFLSQPALIEELVEVIVARDMPPADEPDLGEPDRARLLAGLKAMLEESALAQAPEPSGLRRLNRFQYNNCVRDLFGLGRDVFHLQEKLMTRYDNHLAANDGAMPQRVEVACESLRNDGGMRGVQAFPKDLRATHGFDNEANQLTLSPLLLDSFLRLSVSIVESPDFHKGTVGIWDEFFAEPGADVDVRAEVRRRLGPFLTRAFRGAIDEATLNRYTDYALAKIDEGLSFTGSMKKAASAALSSPRFLLRHGAEPDREDLFVVATNLSFFLWGSGPDLELLRLAGNGELARPEVFDATLEGMMRDPKIERFLDSFPSQWMQLENVLAATPDPAKAKLFSLDRENPASVQMVLEPLLLFDAVFVEDRPVIELVAPPFSYQSEFLRSWYASDFAPPDVDAEAIAAANRERDAQRRTHEAAIARHQAELEALIEPARSRLLADRKKGGARAIDLRAFAAWEFDGDLKDAVGGLDLTAHGKIRFEDGMVVLENQAYLQSASLPVDLGARTLEVWCKVPDIDQRGGGVMGIQGPGDFFDAIVLGERQPRHWISGSNGFSRTLDFPDSKPEDAPDQRLNLVMVYEQDGTTTLYRNGEPYGRPFRKTDEAATFPKGETAVLFGLRHLPAGGNKHLSVSVGRARLYDRALSADEVAAASGGRFVTGQEVVAALSSDQQARRAELLGVIREEREALRRVPPNVDAGKAREKAQRRFEDEVRRRMRSRTFERVAIDDPRYGGVITNAATLSMTSGPTRTHPIARGAWIIEVVFNDPPPPPPNDVPPLNEEDDAGLTIREKFARHREHPDCAGCHARIDPLGFALENYDLVGRWRDTYENGRVVDASGTLMKQHRFDGPVRFKEALVREESRFAKAFTAHLLRFALARELSPRDTLAVEAIVARAAPHRHRLRSLIREVARRQAGDALVLPVDTTP